MHTYKYMYSLLDRQSRTEALAFLFFPEAEIKVLVSAWTIAVQGLQQMSGLLLDTCANVLGAVRLSRMW